MSSSERIEREKALVLSGGIINWLQPYCDKIEVAGSIRREKETVGDIEIVCQPHNRIGLDTTLSGLIENGSIRKATYGKSTRWGDRLKCFILSGVNVELAIGDSDNFGYLMWLRTGPSDGNTFVMTRMMIEKSAMRFAKGYGWLCEYIGDNPTYKHKLSLPDEETVFKAFGFETVINPLWRGEKLYKAEWKGVLPAYQLDALRVNEPKQRRLL